MKPTQKMPKIVREMDIIPAPFKVKEQKPQPNPSLWMSKSEIDKMLADEKAKTLKKIWRIWRKRDWALDAYKYIEAELKKLEGKT